MQTVREGLRLSRRSLGAGLFTLAGGGAVALLDAATFVVAAGRCSRCACSSPPPEPHAGPWLAGMTEGARHLRHTPCCARSRSPPPRRCW